MSFVRLSPKHGVNPSFSQCFFCLKDKNELFLLGRLPEDAEAPRTICMNKEPCEECQEWMKKGIILVSVKNGVHEERDNPYRTGGWVVVSEDFIERIVESPLQETVLKLRFAFVPDKTWDLLGLPRGALEKKE